MSPVNSHASQSSNPGTVAQQNPTIQSFLQAGLAHLANPAVTESMIAILPETDILKPAERLPTSIPSPIAIPKLIRNALFQIESPEDSPPNGHAEVRDRLIRAVGEHLDDVTIELFNAWLWGPRSSVPKQLAKQRKSLGGELDIQDVRRSFLDLGWAAYASVAKCVEALMIDFRGAIRPRLNANETLMFNRLYCCQSCFGGLSLVMLCERLELVGSHILRLLRQPTDQHQLGIFYHLLYFFASMIERRRTVDQRLKQRSSRNQEVSLQEHGLASHQLSLEDKAQLSEIAERFCNREGIRCQCGKFKPGLEVFGFDAGVCSARVFCNRRGCEFSREIEFSAESIRDLCGPAASSD